MAVGLPPAFVGVRFCLMGKNVAASALPILCRHHTSAAASFQVGDSVTRRLWLMPTPGLCRCDLPPDSRTSSLENGTDLCCGVAVGQNQWVQAGGSYPDGGGAKRRAGGQTAEQSTTPSREVGRRAWCVSRRCRGVQHGASLRAYVAA